VREAISIGLLLTRHPPPRISPILPEVARLLTERGARVEPLYPEDGVTDLLQLEVVHDLYEWAEVIHLDVAHRDAAA